VQNESEQAEHKTTKKQVTHEVWHRNLATVSFAPQEIDKESSFHKLMDFFFEPPNLKELAYVTGQYVTGQ
jgi:hypothetical protein